MTTFNFQFNSNLASVNAKLANLALRQIPFAASKALNQTGKELIGVNKRQMSRRFKNPVRYTLNAFRLVRSSKTNLVAEVRRKDSGTGANNPASERNYLERQQSGGTRRRKGVETKFKSRVREVSNMQSLLPTSRTAVRGQNISKARSDAILAGLQGDGKGYPRYFAAKAGSGKSKTGGIYRVNSPKGKPQKLFHTKPNLPAYSKRLPFTDYMTKSARVIFKRAIRAEMRNALRTAKFR